MRINFSSKDSTPGVWKGDFILEATLNQYILPGENFYRTIDFNCTEASNIEFHSSNGIDLRYINNTPTGTFYCYNPNYYFLKLNSRNFVSLKIKTNPRLYPGNYNFTIEFLESDEYAIPLQKGWNLISFPFPLSNSSPENFFSKDSEIMNSVWTYKKGNWIYYKPNDSSSNLNEIIPGRGYWVKSDENTIILVGLGDLLSPRKVPPIVDLDKGWNLIGHYGIKSKDSYCELFSLVNNPGNSTWNSLYKFNNWNDSFEYVNKSNMMNPGEGYWIGMESKGYYFPSTYCDN
jgi:hypothetical protein